MENSGSLAEPIGLAPPWSLARSSFPNDGGCITGVPGTIGGPRAWQKVTSPCFFFQFFSIL